MTDLHDKLKVGHLLESDDRIGKEERIKLNDALVEQQPGFRQAPRPGWWRTVHKTLTMMVNPSNTDSTGTGSSEFTTTYKALDSHDRSEF